MTKNGEDGLASKLILGGSLIVTFIAIITPIISDLQSTKQSLNEVKNTYSTNEYYRGKADQKIEDLINTAILASAALKEADADVQREMRDLDKIIEEKIVSLDRRLQSEITNQGRLTSDALNITKRELEKNTEFQMINREQISQLFERVNALIKRTELIDNKSK